MPTALTSDAPTQGSFTSKLWSFVKAIVQETIRAVRIAWLRAKVTKTTIVDLRRAYRQLGDRAYEVNPTAEEFGQRYLQISALKAAIEANGLRVSPAPPASFGQKIRASMINICRKTHAGLLERRLKRKMVDLGKAIAMADFDELREHLDAVAWCKSRIQTLDAKTAQISDGKRPVFAAIGFLIVAAVALIPAVSKFWSVPSNEDDIREMQRQASFLKQRSGNKRLAPQQATCEWQSLRSRGVFAGPRPCRTEMSALYSGANVQLSIKQSFEYLSAAEVDLVYGDPVGFHTAIPLGMEWHVSESQDISLTIADVPLLVKLLRQYQDAVDSPVEKNSKKFVGKVGELDVLIVSEDNRKLLRFELSGPVRRNPYAPLPQTFDISLEHPEVELLVKVIRNALKAAIDAH